MGLRGIEIQAMKKSVSNQAQIAYALKRSELGGGR